MKQKELLIYIYKLLICLFTCYFTRTNPACLIHRPYKVCQPQSIQSDTFLRKIRLRIKVRVFGDIRVAEFRLDLVQENT